jgi:myosin heavy subunit
MLYVYHITNFQLLFGAPENELSKLYLRKDVDAYFYVSQGKAARVDSISDRQDYKNTMSAFRTLDFNASEVDTIWKIVAAILLLVGFYWYRTQCNKVYHSNFLCRAT